MLETFYPSACQAGGVLSSRAWLTLGARHKNEKLSLHAALEGRSSLTPSHTVSKSPVASKANPNLSQLTSVISDDQLTPLQIRICGNTVHYLEWEQRIYLFLPDCMAAINKPSYLPNRGCKEIGAALERLNVLDCQTFIKLQSSKSENMRWILKKALVALFRDNITFVRSRNEKSVFLSLLQKVKFGREKYRKVAQHFPSDSSDGENISSSENDADDTDVVSSCDSDETASGMGSIPLVNVSGVVWFQGKSSSYAVHNDTVFVDFRSIPFLKSHTESQGFRSIDKILRSKGLCLLSAFITTSNRFQRTHIGTQALLLVLNKLKMCVSDRDSALQCVHDLKDAIILKLATKSASSGHRASPNKNSDKLVQFVNSELGSKASLLEAISQLLCNKKRDFVDLSQPLGMHLNKEDLSHLLGMSAKCPPKKKLVLEAVTQFYKEQCPFSAEDMLHIQENFSGVRLMEAMRKKLPGLVPSVCQERKVRLESRESFRAVLLPRETPTGWSVDPTRLLEVLLYKYHYLDKNVMVRLWGDGREIGGRHSVLMGISIVNNELLLRGISYHDPKDVFPVMICYEGDSRDNLEENLGEPGFLDGFVKGLPASMQVFLCGDHMFLQNILGSETDDLSPNSNDGWHLYQVTGKDLKTKGSQEWFMYGYRP